MSKRTKKLRSNRSNFKLETLEQRQLLATIIAGSGTEVNSNVVLPNGTYDQILLTGSTITVDSDWDAAKNEYQVTRVDFLDADGDIIRAEFSGPGSMKIDLSDFHAAAAPENYNTDVAYVQGLASFTIHGSTEKTNVSFYSLGTANVNAGALNPIFGDGEFKGGSNQANIARLVIESDGGLLGNTFGGIRAGNAVFGDSTGAVGIVADDIQFQGPIVIGGYDVSGSAQGLLHIGQFSATKTITLAGTNLKDQSIDNTGVEKVILATGSDSMGKILATKQYEGSAFDDGFGAGDITYTSAAATVTLNADTTQDDLDAYADEYLNDVVVDESFADSDAFGDFSARLIGNVTVHGDLAMGIHSDINIGAVTIEGSIVEGGYIEAGNTADGGDIGNVSVGDDVDFTTFDYDGTTASHVIYAGGNVGNVTFAGDFASVSNDHNDLI